MKLILLRHGMTEANETGPRADVRDANALSMCLFGRWAWDGYLFGMPQPDEFPRSRPAHISAVHRNIPAASASGNCGMRCASRCR